MSTTGLLGKVAATIQEPIGLVAFVGVLVVWLVVGLRSNRFSKLLRGLQSVPESQRRNLLETEMGQPAPPRMTPAQWLRYKQRQSYLIAFLCTLAAVVLLVAISEPADGGAMTGGDKREAEKRATRAMHLVFSREEDAELWAMWPSIVQQQFGSLSNFRRQLDVMTRQLREVPIVRRALSVEANPSNAAVVLQSETDSGMRWQEQVSLSFIEDEWKITYFAVNLTDWASSATPSIAPTSFAEFVSGAGEASNESGYIPPPGWAMRVESIEAVASPNLCNVSARDRDNSATLRSVYGACDLTPGDRVTVFGLARRASPEAIIEQVRFFPRRS